MPEFPVYMFSLLVISPSHLLQTVLLIVASHCVAMGQSEDIQKLATVLDVVLDVILDTVVCKEISSILLSTTVVMWKQLVTKLIQVRQL